MRVCYLLFYLLIVFTLEYKVPDAEHYDLSEKETKESPSSCSPRATRPSPEDHHAQQQEAEETFDHFEPTPFPRPYGAEIHCRGDCKNGEEAVMEMWKYHYDPSYVDPNYPTTNYQAYYQDDSWYEGPWQDNRQYRQPSPRGPRPKSPRHRGKGSDVAHDKGGKGKGKGNKGKTSQKGKQTMNPGMGPSMKEPRLDWKAALTNASKESPPPGPTPSNVGLSAAEIKLNELTAALQTGDNQLSPQVQGILAQTTVEKSKLKAKEELASNQSTAAKLYTAKSVLAEAQNARATLHAVWQTHLAECVERWTGYQTEFADQDKQLREQVEAAQEALRVARQAWTESKETETMEISDSEENDSKPEAAAIINEGLTSMVRGLTEVKAKTDRLWPEPPAKRVKGDAADSHRSSVMEPFGGPGK